MFEASTKRFHAWSNMNIFFLKIINILKVHKLDILYNILNYIYLGRWYEEPDRTLTWKAMERS